MFRVICESKSFSCNALISQKRVIPFLKTVRDNFVRQKGRYDKFQKITWIEIWFNPYINESLIGLKEELKELFENEKNFYNKCSEDKLTVNITKL